MRAACLLLAIALAATACATGATRQATPTADIPACPADAGVMDGWDQRAPPRKLFGNTWYVGSCGITALLVTSAAGHVLIDGATEQAAPGIAANIRALGFKPSDVRYILNTHEHFDHAGGLAQLQQATAAPVLAMAAAADTLKRGHSDRGDPQFAELAPMPPVQDVRVIADGAVVRVGTLALTAHATPGHAPGGTSWTWRSCEGQRCVAIAYADSVSSPADAQYHHRDHPAYLAAFRHGLDVIANLPCDLLVTPHPLASDLFQRLDGRAPLIAPGACRAYAEQGRNGLDARLAAEGKSEPTP